MLMNLMILANLVNMMILAKFCQNVSYANYLNPEVTRVDLANLVNLTNLATFSSDLPSFIKFIILAKFTTFVKIAASSASLSRAHPLLVKLHQIRHFPSNLDLWQNFVKFAIFIIVCISGHLSRSRRAINKVCS